MIGCDQYLWHLSGNQLDSKDSIITVGIKGQKYFLFIDPYPWDFEIGPSSIMKAVTWALDQGWTPEAGPTRHMAYSKDAEGFIWLPNSIRHIYEMKTEKTA